MNQILYIDKNAKGNKKNGSSTISVKSIIRFFAIVLILFGVILTGNSSYSFYKSIKNKPSSNVIQGNSNIEPPKFTVTQEGNLVLVTVNHSREILNIEYCWNGGEFTTIDGVGQNSLSAQIDIPEEGGVLLIMATDVNGKQGQYSQNYLAGEQTTTDTTKPGIELTLTGSKLEIKATDNKEIAYITYRWNEEEESRLDVNPDSPTIITTTVDVKKGSNILTVIAVDKSNNTQTKKQKFDGVTKPVITVEQVDDRLAIKIVHEVGIDKVDFVFNGQNGYLADDMLGEKTVEFTLPLISGENRIIITAHSKENTEATFDGVCNY